MNFFISQEILASLQLPTLQAIFFLTSHIESYKLATFL